MPACVVDVGTGYTKMGFAGNSEPSYIFPSGMLLLGRRLLVFVWLWVWFLLLCVCVCLVAHVPVHNDILMPMGTHDLPIHADLVATVFLCFFFFLPPCLIFIAAIGVKEKIGGGVAQGVEDLGALCCVHVYWLCAIVVLCVGGHIPVFRSHHDHSLFSFRWFRLLYLCLSLGADFHIGDDAMNTPGYATKYPVRHGIVEDWDLMVCFTSTNTHTHTHKHTHKGAMRVGTNQHAVECRRTDNDKHKHR